MTYFKSMTSIIFMAILLVIPLHAEQSKTINVVQHKGKHIDAVGVVFTINGMRADIGTGTYIGDKRILTAGHLFRSILPTSVDQKSGPVTIDISDKRVYWTNEPILDFTRSQKDLHQAKYLTVDASFINIFKGNIENPTQHDVKCDIAILTLEKPVHGLTKVAIPNDRTEIPEEGLLVGYGRDSVPNHHKHSRMQALHGMMDMGDWGILMSNLSGDMASNPFKDSQQENTKMELLLGKDSVNPEDIQITRASQGDSGGPLMALSEDGKVHVIGVMSANSKVFNAFASLLVKTPIGYFRNQKVDELIRAAG
jgi:hypothetical protein